MAKKLIIRHSFSTNDFFLSLDGTEIKDIKSYEVIQEAGKGPSIRLEIAILREIEVQM